MKLKLVIAGIFFLLLSIFTYAQSSEPLAAYRMYGKWHVIGHDGKELLPPLDYADVAGYSEGLLRVRFGAPDSAWAFINLKGQIIFKANADFVNNFYEGMAMTVVYADESKTTKKFGFVNKSGRQVVPNIYDEVLNFSEGLAFVMNKETRGYIDTTGKFVFRLINKLGYDFHEGLAIASTPAFKMGYINKRGEDVIAYAFDEAGNFSEGLAKYNLEGKFGYINKAGKKIINNSHDDARDFHEGRAFVGALDLNYSAKWGIIDTTGKFISYYLFNNSVDFSEGLAAVRKDSTWGFVDKSGAYSIPSHFSSANSFKNGLAWASKKSENKMGFINNKGEFMVLIPGADRVVDLRWNRRVL